MKRSARDNEESVRVISRRTLLLGGMQFAFMAVLAARMRYMQVDQADQFRLLAEENRINLRLIPPARGLILDRNGVMVGANEQNYRVVLVREDAGDVDAVIARLTRLIHMPQDDIDRALREIRRFSPFVPVTVADRLSWDDFAAVAVNAPALPGVTPEVGLSRHYPFGADFAHVVGYVGPVSDYDLAKLDDPDPLLQIPKFQIGKVGVETKLETDLRGAAGTKRIEVNAVGRVMREIDRDEGVAGVDVTLTIDSALQSYTQARLGDESAAAVVIDVTSGDILAINSAPSFDPNKFVRGISVADYALLTENDRRPLADKSVQGIYPPGSTFKMTVALAALEAGVIGPGDRVYCPGYLTFGDRRFSCWKHGGHGSVGLQTALEQSCDVFFYEVSQRVGIDRIAEMARRLGIGTKFDLPMSAVATGVAPDKAWKAANIKADWTIGDTINASIGQGFVLASPLQLAVMTARIASGNVVTPRLIKAINGIEQPTFASESLGIARQHLTLVRAGMEAVTNSQRGTAYGSRVEEASMRLAGKTGTSQVRNITAAERASGVISNDDLPWERRDHALFVAFAPVEAPRIAVSLIVEHGGGGSAVAAPVARDILLQALYGGLPPLAAYPSSQRQRIENERKLLPLRPPQPPAPGQTRA